MNNPSYSDPALLEDNGYRRITLGLRPSGSIHIGTALTFMQGMKAVYNNDDSFLDVYVLDLDFDRQREKDFVSFMHKKSDCGCHELVKEHTMEEVTNALDEMACYLGVDPTRISITYFSDLTENPEFQNYIAKLFASREGRILLKKNVIGKSQKASTLISPICECGHSSVKPPRMVAEKNGYLLRAECYNDYCDVKRYELNLTDPRRLNIHYMVATVRDLCKKGETEKADIHVFGGDYMLRSYKKGEEPKIVKVTKFLDGISNDPPKVYVGPLLLYNKKRIRKSIESCFTLDCIEQKRPDWAEGLHRMLEDHLEDFVIDMSGMDKYFS